MKVVLLLGSSTAGKSTLCNELVTKHKWRSVSVDEICEKIIFEQKPKLELEIRDELTKQDLFIKLQSHLSEDEILTLAGFGQLTISRGDHQITQRMQFPNPSLPELEQILKNAGFNESVIQELAVDFRLVTRIGCDINEKNRFSIHEIMDRLYDETFNHDPEASIILDLVPDQNGEYDIFEHFEKRVQRYRDENPERSLTTSLVLAYCTPQKLSERIDGRNRNAEEKGNLGDKRVGLFPFHQLARLVTVKSNKNDSTSENFSRNELFYLVDKHAHMAQSTETIFIENPVDVEAWQQTVDRDVNYSPANDQPRIGSKKTIEEYTKLAKRFGFFENQERSYIAIQNKERYDVIINTAMGHPASLANELLEKLEDLHLSLEMGRK